MPSKKMADEKFEKLYGEAELIIGAGADVMKAQGLLAYANRREGGAMRVLSFVWGRNARHLSTAVSRWPQYFFGVDGVPIALEPEEYQVLYMLAALPKDDADILHDKWRRYGWRAWKVREAVEDWRGEQRDPNLLKLRGHAKITSVEKTTVAHSGEQVHTVTLQLSNPKSDPKASWRGKRVNFLLTETRGEE